MAARLGKKIPSVNTDTLRLLLNYPYSGNVRELKNIIEHGVILCRNGEITVDNLPQCVLGRRKKTAIAPMHTNPDMPFLDPLAAKEREAIMEVLAANDWSVQKAAHVLGIDRTTLWRKMKKGGVSRQQEKRQIG
jgi:DNA-binding NtrC family response regulator